LRAVRGAIAKGKYRPITPYSNEYTPGLKLLTRQPGQTVLNLKENAFGAAN
jgi:hypothetical protein